MSFKKTYPTIAGNTRILVSLALILPILSSAFAVTRYSPQLSVGSQGGLTAETVVTFINKSAISQRIFMVFFAPDGDLLGLGVRAGANSYDSVASLGFDLGSGGTRSFTLYSDGELERGWIRFATEDDLNGDAVVVQTTFQNLDAAGNVVAAVGVPVREAGREYFVAVQASEVQDIGVAVANPDNAASATVTFSLVNAGGFSTDRTPLTISLGGGEQIARFVTTGESPLFPGNEPLVDHRLIISSDQPIAVLALRADFGGSFLISSIPVVEASIP